MKNWILAGAVIAVLGFFVVETPAQEPLKAPGTTVSPGIVQGEIQNGPVVRTGLFRRRVVSSNFVPSTTVVPPTTTTRVEPLPPTTTTVVPMNSTIVEPRVGLFGRLRAR